MAVGLRSGHSATRVILRAGHGGGSKARLPAGAGMAVASLGGMEPMPVAAPSAPPPLPERLLVVIDIERTPWPWRARDHKRGLIDELLGLYPDLPFIFVGDSGQHDPEIYAGAVDRWGPRIACSYIRDVTDDPDRAAEIERVARRVATRAARWSWPPPPPPWPATPPAAVSSPAPTSPASNARPNTTARRERQRQA